MIALLLVDERSVMDGGERPGWPEARERERRKRKKARRKDSGCVLGVMIVLCRPAGGLDGVSVSVRGRASGAPEGAGSHKDL